MTKQEAQQKIDEATKNYEEACRKFALRHPKREEAFKLYREARQECTSVLYG
jgi:hypothetical protein